MKRWPRTGTSRLRGTQHRVTRGFRRVPVLGIHGIDIITQHYTISEMRDKIVDGRSGRSNYNLKRSQPVVLPLMKLPELSGPAHHRSPAPGIRVGRSKLKSKYEQTTDAGLAVHFSIYSSLRVTKVIYLPCENRSSRQTAKRRQLETIAL